MSSYVSWPQLATTKLAAMIVGNVAIIVIYTTFTLQYSEIDRYTFMLMNIHLA